MTAIGDLMAERYDGVTGSAEGIRLTRERVHWLCRQATGAEVLDAGCSQGVAAVLLGREGKRVTGVDIRQEAIDDANERLAAEEGVVRDRVSFRTGELYALPFEDASFDTVLLGEVLEHLLDLSSALAELRRVLRPGGTLVITTPYGIWRSADHKDPLYLGTLLEALGSAFDVSGATLISGERNAFLGLVATAADAAAPAVPWPRLLEVAESRLAAQDLALERLREQLAAANAQARDERVAAAERYRELRASEAERRKELAAREAEKFESRLAKERAKLVAAHEREVEQLRAQAGSDGTPGPHPPAPRRALVRRSRSRASRLLQRARALGSGRGRRS